MRPGRGAPLPRQRSRAIPGFVLQKNSDLTSTTWVSAPDPVTQVGTNKRVSVSPVDGSGFFRLMLP